MARKFAKSVADINRQYDRIVSITGGYNSNNSRRIRAERIRDAYERNISNILGRSVLGSYLDAYRKYSRDARQGINSSRGAVSG